MENWTAFWFEGNMAWGHIDTPEKWEGIKEQYPDTDLGRAREFPDANTHYYGFRRECRGTKRLHEFFNEHRMKL